MEFSIEHFWQPRLEAVKSPESKLTRTGWSVIDRGDDSYVQAELSLRSGFDDLEQPVWLIAAPGAVGKSTLTKEICAASHAVYVDLAIADAVGGSYVVGGLVNNALWDQWKAGQTTVLIDALDEARLRVTQAAFDDFLVDVANVAKQGRMPLVLIGRVGIIEECWTLLNDKAGLSCPIFDIELFDADQAVNFVVASLRKLSRTSHKELKNPLETHPTVYQDAAKKIVERLAETSLEDGRRFVGYAPVLEAIAKVIAGETNPSQVGQSTLRIFEGRILDRLAIEIMQRETKKLVAQLQVSVAQFPTEGVYEEDEQLVRLASRIFGVGNPAVPACLPQHAIGPYERAVASFLEQHPFLDGTGRGPSGAVFGACIVAHALRGSDSDLTRAAEAYSRTGHHVPNPFLFDFYLGPMLSGTVIPAEHIGILFESIQAKIKVGEIARLSVDGDKEEDHIDAEISIGHDNGDPIRIDLRAKNGTTLRFGRRLAGISVEAERMDVEIGEGGQLELVAPVGISVRTLLMQCNELVVKTEPSAQPEATRLTDQGDDLVTLEAQSFVSDQSSPIITVRQGTALQVTWPGSKGYPWTSFSSEEATKDDPATADALRTLRRLVISFRSHSKGRLARFKGKIEHARMTKGGLGDAIRRKLIKDAVLSLEGTMYYLDPKRLGSVVGISFLNAKLKKYGPTTRAYVQGL